MSAMDTIFITGVTGFLGRHLAVRMLARDDLDRLYCLVRADNEEHGRERLRGSLARVVPEQRAEELMARVVAVPGDLRKDGLGIAEGTMGTMLREVTVVLHAAADVRFNQDLEDARDRNVAGTARVADLARQMQQEGALRRFDWVGTAFVAGLRTDLVGEDELVHEEGWKNSYEQSKYEAELLLRRSYGDLPMTILRPSIIVGESNTGQTSNFGMLYWPVQLYARGWWRTIVGKPTTPVDLVPVDYVADAILALTGAGRPVGGTYHLAAGPDGILTIEELADLTRKYFGGKPARYIAPDTFFRWIRPVVDLFLWGKKRQVIQAGGRFFVPYFNGNPRFDIRHTREALEGTDVSIPSVLDYIEVLFDYCRETDFGRNSLDSA
mgnify:CR=1 FL=1